MTDTKSDGGAPQTSHPGSRYCEDHDTRGGWTDTPDGAQTPAAGALTREQAQEAIDHFNDLESCPGLPPYAAYKFLEAIARGAPPQPTAQQAHCHTCCCYGPPQTALAQPTAQEPPDLVQRSSSDCTTVPGLSGDSSVAERWQPIASAPYDTVCLFLIDGHVVESFIYDGTADEMFGKGRATHWMPLPAPPLPETPPPTEDKR